MNVVTSKNNSLVRMPVEVHIWVVFMSVAMHDVCVCVCVCVCERERFEVTVAVTVKISVVCAVTQYSLVETFRRVKEICREQ